MSLRALSPRRSVVLLLVLSLTGGCAHHGARGDTSTVCASSSNSRDQTPPRRTASRWLATQSATALHVTGNLFVGMGNVGLQIGGTQGAGGTSGREWGVYLGITLVSAGSIGLGQWFIAGGEHLDRLATDAPVTADAPCRSGS